MKCLVTGAGGFLGSEIVRQLIDIGHKVRVLLMPGETSRNLDKLELDILVGDIRDKDLIKVAVTDMDYLFHVASLYDSTPFYVKYPEHMYEINVEGTRNVCQAALDAGIKKVVYTSSCASIGVRDNAQPSDESINFNQLEERSHYEKSKALAENEAMLFHKRGLWIAVINPAFLIGAGDIRPTPTGEVILKYLKRTYPCYFDAVMYLSDVVETAKAHISVLERGSSGERYIVCFDKGLSVSELFCKLETLSGVKKPRLKLPLDLLMICSIIQEAILGLLGLADKVKPIISYEMLRYLKFKRHYDNSKAKHVLKFQSTSIDDSLHHSVEWYRRNLYV